MTEQWGFPEYWEKHFNRTDFPGDKRRATELMMEVAGGMQWVRDAVKDEMDLPLPHLRTYGGRGFGEYNPRDDTVYVGLPLLVQASRMRRDERLQSYVQRTCVFDGPVDKKLWCHGIEECDHKRFTLQSGAPEKLLDPDVVGAAFYDAQDHEYEALKMQLKAAYEEKLPLQTNRIWSCTEWLSRNNSV